MASIKDLQDQMNKNSQAWHGANKAEQDRLHKENERLQSQIDSMTGGSSTFNPGTGKWTTTGGSSGSKGSSSSGKGSSGGGSSGKGNSASGVGVNTGIQQQIKDQMNQNSNAWWGPATRKRSGWRRKTSICPAC